MLKKWRQPCKYELWFNIEIEKLKYNSTISHLPYHTILFNTHTLDSIAMFI